MHIPGLFFSVICRITWNCTHGSHWHHQECHYTRYWYCNSEQTLWKLLCIHVKSNYSARKLVKLKTFKHRFRICTGWIFIITLPADTLAPIGTVVAINVRLPPFNLTKIVFNLYWPNDITPKFRINLAKSHSICTSDARKNNFDVRNMNTQYYGWYVGRSGNNCYEICSDFKLLTTSAMYL